MNAAYFEGEGIDAATLYEDPGRHFRRGRVSLAAMSTIPTDFRDRAAAEGLLVSARRDGGGAPGAADAYAGFHALPVYRAYVHGLQSRDLPEGFVAALAVPRAVDLVREPDNHRDRRAVAVYADAHKLGYLPREDNRVLGKLIRRGVPVSCRLIGVQDPAEAPDHQRLALEVALLYPPHPVTDPAIARAEADRLAGLAEVAAKPPASRKATGDPLSAGHVYPGYYRE